MALTFIKSMSDSLPHVVDINWRLDYCIKVKKKECVVE